MLLAFLVGFCVTTYIGVTILAVFASFGVQTVQCYCGKQCAVSQDGWFHWECSECGESGKANPFT